MGNGTPLIADLAAEKPVIVGLSTSNQSGHVYVLSEIRYMWNPYSLNVPIFDEVRLFDPDPVDGGWTDMSGDEFSASLDFAVRINPVYM